MNQPNPDQQSHGSSPYDNLSDDELRKLINDAARVKTGRTGNIQPQVRPAPKKEVDLTHILGGLH